MKLISALAQKILDVTKTGTPMRHARGVVVSSNIGQTVVTIDGGATQINAFNYAHVQNLPAGTVVDLLLSGRKAYVIGSYARAPQFWVYLSAGQTLGNAAQTVLNFDTVALDTAGQWNAAGHYYEACPGMWLFSAQLAWNTNATGSRGLCIGGAPIPLVAANNDSSGRQTNAGLFYFSTPGSIQVSAYQSSGGNLATLTGSNAAFVGIRIG